MSWMLTRDKEKYGVAIENFNGESVSELCLKLSVGDTIHVLEVFGSDWAYGYITYNQEMKGIFPRAYIQNKECTVDRSGPVERVIPKLPPVIQELTAALRAWGKLLRPSFIGNKVQFKEAYDAIVNLIHLRKTILSGKLPQDELKRLKQEVTYKIDRVNRLFNLDLVVRDDQGNILNTKITSTTVLLRTHIQTDTLLSRNSKDLNSIIIPSTRKIHQAWTLEVSFTNIILKVPSMCEISAALHVLAKEDARSAISEPYVFHWTPQGNFYTKFHCMYTDLGEKLLNESSLWLVGVVVQEGKPLASQPLERRMSTVSLMPHKKISPAMLENLRRPHGVFAVEISENVRKQIDTFSPTSSTVNTLSCEAKANFVLCGEKESLDSVTKRLMSQEIKASDGSVFVDITLHNGNMNTLRQDYPHHHAFKEVPVAPSLSLADIFVPGYIRNDLYVTLVSAEISKGSKMSDKNVEVTVKVFDKENKLMTGVLSTGVGNKLMDEYRTVVYYHEGKPRWNETVKVAIPIDQFKGAHIRFLFRHRSMNEGKEKHNRPFALSFITLMLENGTTLVNKEHDLYLYNIEHKKWRDEDFEYLSQGLPWLRSKSAVSPGKLSSGGLSLSTKDAFTISTTFCSTKLTQNEQLLRLLEWSGRLSANNNCLNSNGNSEQEMNDKNSGQRPAEELRHCLLELKRIDWGDMIIFLQDTLDVLLLLLHEAPHAENLKNTVFEAFVDVVYIAVKQHRGEPVLKAYIEHNFSAAMVYSNLIELMKEYIDKCSRYSFTSRSSIANFRNSAISNDAFNLSQSNQSLEKVENTSSESEKLPESSNPSSILNKAMKSLPYIMRFIIKSRQLYAKYYVHGHEEFCSLLESLFESMSRLMHQGESALAIQGQCLKYLPDIIPEVITVFNPLTLSHCLIKILYNIAPGQLPPQKLSAIEQICHSEIFRNDECRDILLKSFVKLLKNQLDSALEMLTSNAAKRGLKSAHKVNKLFGESDKVELQKELDRIKNQDTNKKEEVVKVVEILEVILDVLHSEQSSPLTPLHMQFMTDELLLQVLQLAYKTPLQDPVAIHYAGIIMGLVRQVDGTHLQSFLSQNKELHVDLLVDAIMNFLENPVFKPDWAQMTLLLNNILLTLLKMCAAVIHEHLKDPFGKDIWHRWFLCTIRFLTQPSLQIEKFVPSKRSKIKTLYMDMRKIAAEEIKRMWYGLGQHKIVFISRAGKDCLVAPMLEMTLIPEPELRRSTIPIFFDMMQCEYYSSLYGLNIMGDKDAPFKGNFDDFENEMLVQLDHYVGSGYGDDHYCNVFSNILNGLCTNHNTLSGPGLKFVRTIRRQLKRLLQYRLILYSPDHSIETCMCSTVYLLDFYSEFSNKELYVRYVNKLVELHLQTGNLTEAGFALHEHAKILTWKHVKLSKALISKKYPEVDHHDVLKEKLYEDVIKYMEEGSMWECALERCKELVSHYENTVMDYTKLASLLSRMSKCYQEITNPKNLRPAPEYFRVAYYGKGFPAFLQNKIFVHRGNGYERLSEFQSRVMGQFANAKLLTKLTVPDQEIQDSPEQHIQINKVECVPLETKFTKPGVCEYIRNFYKVNAVKHFAYSRPFHRGEKVPNNEFATLWVEKTSLQTEYDLPGILRCFPVTHVSTVELSPLCNAIDTMRNNNSDLRDLVQSHSLRHDLPLDSLTRKLSGMIDAAVMGGVANYEKAFLHEEYINSHPEEEADIETLKKLISEMVPLLEYGLIVHSARVSGTIVGLHDHMLTEFAKMKELLISKYGKATDPDLGISRRSLHPLRQVSVDSTGGRNSHNGDTPSPHFNVQRRSMGSGYGTLPRNKLSSGSLNNKNKKDKKFSRILRRDSQTSKEGQSFFYDQSAINQQTPIFEITESLVPERPLRSEASRLSRPASLVSTNTIPSMSSSTPTGGSVESLSERDSQMDIPKDEPPPLPVKTRTGGESDRLSVRGLLTKSSSLSSDSPPKKPPRPQ